MRVFLFQYRFKMAVVLRFFSQLRPNLEVIVMQLGKTYLIQRKSDVCESILSFVSSLKLAAALLFFSPQLRSKALIDCYEIRNQRYGTCKFGIKYGTIEKVTNMYGFLLFLSRFNKAGVFGFFCSYSLPFLIKIWILRYVYKTLQFLFLCNLAQLVEKTPIYSCCTFIRNTRQCTRLVTFVNQKVPFHQKTTEQLYNPT